MSQEELQELSAVGYISAEDAIDWGLSGPTLRGSGVHLDIRRANPYTGYEKYDFQIPTEPDCDVWARYLVQYIRWVNELNADLVVVTGDLITGGYRFAERIATLLSHVKAKHGVICLTRAAALDYAA